MLEELAYVSSNKKHPWKRREVGMLLIGQFSDDISMYALRNDKFYFMTLVGNILSPEIPPNAKITSLLRSLLAGRMFATCFQIGDLMNVQEKETQLYMKRVIAAAFQILIPKLNMPLSVKMSATRCLIKFLRKIPQDCLP